MSETVSKESLKEGGSPLNANINMKTVDNERSLVLRHALILFVFIVACVVVGGAIYHILYKICKSRRIRKWLFETFPKLCASCKPRNQTPSADASTHFLEASDRVISPPPRN